MSRARNKWHKHFLPRLVTTRDLCLLLPSHFWRIPAIQRESKQGLVKVLEHKFTNGFNWQRMEVSLGRNSIYPQIYQGFLWKRREFFSVALMAETGHWVEVTENRHAATSECESSYWYGHISTISSTQPSAREAAANHMKSLSNPKFLWCYYFPKADFFFLSDIKVFEIKLIITSQRRETLSNTLCGPAGPRTIKKTQKVFHQYWLADGGFDILSHSSSSCHNHWSPSAYCRESRRKTVTHTRMGILKDMGKKRERKMEKWILNYTYLQRKLLTHREWK